MKTDPSTIPELKLFPGHEGMYHYRDLKYVVRMMRKLATALLETKADIDWLQCYIEQFLLLNSRIYSDSRSGLIQTLIEECQQRHKMGDDSPKVVYERAIDPATRSFAYHDQRKRYRHRAAHGSNYLRVGIPEFANDILPKPIGYSQTTELENMAAVDDFIAMWRADMERSANEAELTITRVIEELNKHV